MDTQASLDLETLYGPIEEPMRAMGRFLEVEFSSRESFIADLLHHVARFHGKQIRPALLFLSTRLAGGKVGGDHIKIGGVVELIHTATLVHDDILDDAALRRRVETIHRRWGERAAVLLGDYIYSRAFHLSTQVPGMAEILSDTTHTICEGELLQIAHRFRPVDEFTYFDIIRKKTAILYAVSCEIGGRLGGLDAARCRLLHDFGMDLGMAFQIVDDCLDYSGKEALVGKSLGTDLRLGKMTLPLIYLLDALEEKEGASVRARLDHPLDEHVEAWIRTLLLREGSVAEAFRKALAFVDAAKGRLDGIANSEVSAAARESLEQVADYVLRRQK
jgi:octaprenyl-diphosphate synthase